MHDLRQFFMMLIIHLWLGTRKNIFWFMKSQFTACIAFPRMNLSSLIKITLFLFILNMCYCLDSKNYHILWVYCLSGLLERVEKRVEFIFTDQNRENSRSTALVVQNEIVLLKKKIVDNLKGCILIVNLQLQTMIVWFMKSRVGEHFPGVQFWMLSRFNDIWVSRNSIKMRKNQFTTLN